MKNWAGNIVFNPSTVAYPTTEEDIQKIVLKAANDRKKVRIIGTGHSFTAVCATDDVLISLDHYQGIVSTDKNLVQATVKGGTKLNYLGELLFQEGMAMENLGDIDVQSIAGTISTGTHGTGKAFGTISTQVVALRFINGKGEIVECSETNNRALFKAAQVSLGTFGVITQLTLQCVPIYKLALYNRKEPLADVLATIDQRNAANRNFEFYWMPYTDMAYTKTTNVVEAAEPDKINFFNYWTEYVLENYVFKLFCELAHWFPSKNEFVSKLTADSASDVKKVYYSHKIYATQRLVRFREMEYNVPAEAYDEVIKDVMKVVNSKKYNIHFPIENRWVEGDDILMSPAYQRDSAYIACHVYAKKDHQAYFAALEEVFRAYGGRPHWGKMNSLQPQDVAALYPEFEAFTRFRKLQDPDGVFFSPYLAGLFGIDEEAKILV
ncbi:MAG: D-arabinono-1,4-lactone oxidase [Bacteroidota bacterium]